jgi:hypothetical protein
MIVIGCTLSIATRLLDDLDKHSTAPQSPATKNDFAKSRLILIDG